jgi:hypothetical protein
MPCAWRSAILVILRLAVAIGELSQVRLPSLRMKHSAFFFDYWQKQNCGLHCDRLCPGA